MAWTALYTWAAGRVRLRQADTFNARLPSRPRYRSVSINGSSMSSNRGSINAELRPIPRRVRSLDGQTVDTYNDPWAFHSSIDGGQLLLLSWEVLRKLAVF